MTSIEINPHGEDALEDGPPGERPQYGDPVQAGDLLTLRGPKLLAALSRFWEARKDEYRRWQVEWDVNARRRDGEHNVWAVKTPDQASWQVWSPPGASKLPPAVMNKADRLCQRLVSQVYADPPVADPIPATGEDADKDSAELAGRILVDLQSEATLNEVDAHRAALDLANSTRSAFVHYWVDPRGGGRQPIECMAAPQAQTVEEALVDPLTGLPWPVDPITRYVRADGTLTDTVSEAALRWVPKLTRDVLHPAAVRFLPYTALDLWDADGALVAAYRPFHLLAQRYAALDGVDPEQVTSVRPTAFAGLLPKKAGKPHDPDKGDPRQRLALELVCYLSECPDYPDGARIILVGDTVVVQEPWVGAAAGTREALDLPLTQLRQFRGPLDDPHGRGLMDFLGNANEYRAHLVGVSEDILDRNANRKVFVPTNSILQSKAHQLPFMTYVPINPGGEPKYEDLVPVPPELPGLIEFVTREMDDASGLQEMGQGLQAPGVNSGRQALAIVSQVHAGLSDLRQNAERAFLRACRVQLQLVRKFYTIPQLVRWAGEDGSYKARRWLGSDLGSTRDVRLKPGTLSMMAPMQKAALVQQYAAIPGMLPVEDVREMLASNVGGTIGLQDDPHVLRVKRQVDAWRQGPPEGWTPSPPMPPLPDPMTGALVPPPPPPLPPGFAPIPADSLPIVAAIRVRELGRAMAGTAYAAQPPEWRAVLDQMFAQAQQVLAPPPMAPPPGEGGPNGPPPGPPPGPQTAPPLMRNEQAVLGPSATQPTGLA